MPRKGRAAAKVSEYEEQRLKNLDDNKAMLAKLLSEIKDLKPLPKTINAVPVKRQHKHRLSEPAMLHPRRSTRLNPYANRPVTRACTRSGSLSSSGSERSSRASSPSREDYLLVRFGPGKDYDDENFVELRTPRRRPSHCLEREIKSPEEITKKDIDMIAQYAGRKVYDHVLGSTCHQCRQKTIDTKTICRSEDCHGVRGYFCGPCLKNRYGEDVATALKDPKWICPPCRGICNCSICRTRNGKAATGILIHLAQEHGFNDCASFLASIAKKK